MGESLEGEVGREDDSEKLGKRDNLLLKGLGRLARVSFMSDVGHDVNMALWKSWNSYMKKNHCEILGYMAGARETIESTPKTFFGEQAYEVYGIGQTITRKSDDIVFAEATKAYNEILEFFIENGVEGCKDLNPLELKV